MKPSRVAALLSFAGVLAAGGCVGGRAEVDAAELAGTYAPEGREQDEVLVLHGNGTFTHAFLVLHRLSVVVVGAWRVTGQRVQLRPVASGDASRSGFPLEFDLVGHGASRALIDAEAPADRRGHADMWHRVPALAGR